MRPRRAEGRSASGPLTAGVGSIAWAVWLQATMTGAGPRAKIAAFDSEEDIHYWMLGFRA